MATTGSNPVKREAELRVAVFGATGYTGLELLCILVRHPRVGLALLSSQQYAGKRVSEVYPSLTGRCEQVLEKVNLARMISRFDLAFTALPHETSMDIVPALLKHGKRVIDLSADFRLRDVQVYRRWYRPHKAAHLLRRAVYGLTEIHREEISQAALIANPGCYPTGAVLGLAPLFAAQLIQGTVLIDAKSGTTGAGRSSAVELSFSEVNENFKAYNVGVHRHAPEIEQELSRVAKKSVAVLFAPHLLPISRGILSTMYLELKRYVGEGRLSKIYREFYRGESFIRILPPGVFPETKEVRGSNDCAIGFRYDSHSRRLVVITAIDNLVKGAAGQAVQNMNLMYGFDETEGLLGAGLVP
ncbi:MAG: N-acetyl-gamma-glutamyl-phosphate reductase [Deltaproteobacteria bacterium]|nr:N-acetyl-gamma-glutamyl-phosphate reductase [Deltaproteobacteria bacterium]